MAHWMTLPVAATLAIGGTGLGVFLGQSAVAEIDPVYFSSPPSGSRFHADLSPNPGTRDWSNQSLPDARQVSFYDCVGCRTYPEEYRPTTDPEFEAYVASYAMAEPDVIIDDVDREIAAMTRRAAIEAEFETVARYTDYPVAADAEREDAALAYATPDYAPPEPVATGEKGCTGATQCAGAPTPGI